jgi:hypothetical protein
LWRKSNRNRMRKHLYLSQCNCHYITCLYNYLRSSVNQTKIL